MQRPKKHFLAGSLDALAQLVEPEYTLSRVILHHLRNHREPVGASGEATLADVTATCASAARTAHHGRGCLPDRGGFAASD
jgi:hypothetical protein